MYGSRRGEVDPRKVVAAPGMPGGPFDAATPALDATVLPQDLTFEWARTGRATVGNVIARRVPGTYGSRVDVSVSLPAGTLGMEAPVIGLTMDPDISTTGVFWTGNFGNLVTLWDSARPGDTWSCGSGGAVSRTGATQLLLQGVIVRNPGIADPRANRIRISGLVTVA